MGSSEGVRPHILHTPDIIERASRCALRLDLTALVSYRSIIWPPVASGNIPHFFDAWVRDWEARWFLGISGIDVLQIGYEI